MKSKAELMPVNQKLVRMSAKNYGEIGCGSNVVIFPPKNEYLDVLVPKGLAKPEQVGTIAVNGESLSDYGIFTGDILVFRTNFNRHNITPDTICIIRINETGEMLAKRIRTTQPGYVTLVSSGGGIKDVHIEENGVEVVGIVFAVQKMADVGGRFAKLSDKDLPF